VKADTGRLSLPAILVHGGAGNFERVGSEADAAGIREGLEAALAAGWASLLAGGTALEAVVEAVANLEDSARFNAGRGAVSTSAGSFELDAGVMDGTTGKVGAVCAVTWPANPVRVACKVAEIGGPPGGPVLLAGPGADRFSEEWGFEQMTASMRAASTGETEDDFAGLPSGPLSEAGTVGAVAVDAEGRVAAATSTGGRSGQLAGRVGDTPVPGAGVWADSATAAVSATGAGEAFVVAGFGHRIDWEMRAGLELEAAVRAGLDAVARLGGDGGGIAITPDGTFAASFSSRAMARGWRDARGPVTRVMPTPAG
jgi:isoaspartyl peptidase/L-asparaginase-like protein (Ntn-hydrolase superfamily)